MGHKASSGELAEVVKTVVYALLIALVIRVVLFQPFTIPSASMEPALFQGDYIIVSKFAYGWSRHSLPFSPDLFKGRVLGRQPRRGDIIVFKLPRDGHTDYIKRLIGLPGDRIQLKQGVVYINGQAVARRRIASGLERGPFGLTRPVERFQEELPNGKVYVTNSYGPDGEAENTSIYVVPPGHYFVLGDNRDNSADSRFSEADGVGYVPFENFIARADVVISPGGKDADGRPIGVLRSLN